MKKGDRIVGIDLGTTKVAVIVAEIDENGKEIIVGLGQSESKGMKKGNLVNMNEATESVANAIQEAEKMIGDKIKAGFVGISGNHIESRIGRGVVSVYKPGSEITAADKERVIEMAKQINLQADREIIHVIPVEFIVDEQEGLSNPVGMFGQRLEVVVHLVTGLVNSAKNLYRAVERAGVSVIDLVLQPLASAFAVLTDDEKDLGVALVDIGGGTSDIAIFKNGVLRHTEVIGVGGEYVTNDISEVLRISKHEAERVKRKYGVAIIEKADENNVFKVKEASGREKDVNQKVLAEIIEARLAEILSFVKDKFDKKDLTYLMPTGIVLTGGSANLLGMEELAEKVFDDIPVRIGIPSNMGGLTDIIENPMYATGVGLVKYGIERSSFDGLPASNSSDRQIFKAIIEKMKRWVGEIF